MLHTASLCVTAPAPSPPPARRRGAAIPPERSIKEQFGWAARAQTHCPSICESIKGSGKDNKRCLGGTRDAGRGRENKPSLTFLLLMESKQALPGSPEPHGWNYCLPIKRVCVFHTQSHTNQANLSQLLLAEAQQDHPGPAGTTPRPMP